MFAIPGILALIFFIYIRPQEVMTSLQAVPLLYVFFALALFGLAVDLKRRINRFAPSPHTLWVVGYLLWSLLTMAVFAPDKLIQGGMLLMIPLLLYLLIAQGVRSFRSLELIAALLFATGLLLGLIGAFQGRADFECVMIDQATVGAGTAGSPDGRPCITDNECFRGDPEPGAEYMCERVGLLQTTSIAGGRVRYRGVLADPNELGLAITLSLMIGVCLYVRRPTPLRFLVLAIAFVLIAMAVMYTRSRSAQLALVMGLVVWAVWRFRWRAVLLGVVFLGPLLVAISAGSGRSDADSSTEERLEAWGAAIDMFKSSPILGVGAGQFTQHHQRTAHNSFMLAVGETGLVGATLWALCLYVSFKIAIVAIRRYHRVPGAEVAVVWSVGLISVLTAMVFGSTFISWTTHEVFWMHIGLAGALYAAIRAHDADFHIRISVFEVVMVALGCLVDIGLTGVYLRVKGF